MMLNNQIIVGNVRVQALSNTLLRIEEAGAGGFEDRPTFTVLERDFSPPECLIEKTEQGTALITDSYRVVVSGSTSLVDVRVESTAGELLYQYDGQVAGVVDLPSPGDAISVWVMADSPRIVPPEWGATPPPEKEAESPTSGWDVDNDAPDVYIFIPGTGGYAQFKRDFLRLTGPIPLPPLFTFGLIDSRYYPYSEESALETIDKYRGKGIPLDVFVVDTDWRIGASHGYRVNEDLFPDIEKFIRRAHVRQVRLLFNDHPEPFVEGALDPQELQYRYDGLTSLLDKGADVWWYDRNWMVHLDTPVPGFVRDVWGQRLYHDITARFRPARRPLIMSNVAGIMHGKRLFPAHPAEHRYPIWWTGDTVARWEFLRLGMQNAVDYGAAGLMPYVHEDLGGHSGNPNAELYVRFVQFGVFSPVCRLHCTSGETRFPWAFGDEAEQIAGDYIRLRYRLLPVIYAAARQAHENGTPILRRLDLEWPEHPGAKDPSQYLFGEDLLVAPMHTGRTDYTVIGSDHLRTLDGDPGVLGEYYASASLGAEPALTRVDQQIDISWESSDYPDGVTGDAFSARWTGRLVEVPETGTYSLGVNLFGRVRIVLNGEQIMEQQVDDYAGPIAKPVHLQKGSTNELLVEYYQTGWKAMLSLVWLLPSKATALPTRDVWLPPGGWMDAWSGLRLEGPASIQVSSELWHTPIYQREGGVVFSLPQMQHTSERPWDTLILDAVVPHGDMTVTRTLYEDDGLSTAYLEGAFCKTPVLFERVGTRVVLRIANIEGNFPGHLNERTWVLRLHLPLGEAPQELFLDGGKLAISSSTGPGENAAARVFLPQASGSELPFRGQGTAPGKDAGLLLEVIVQDKAVNEGVELMVNLVEEIPSEMI